ncbi:hypothetical protein, partial [Xanthomonas vasicola]|uniref:hypothetical protein n=1 Tax=Xanthomonas vasicola TaxID=56459 RepID=UPI0038AD94B0
MGGSSAELHNAAGAFVTVDAKLLERLIALNLVFNTTCSACASDKANESANAKPDGAYHADKRAELTAKLDKCFHGVSPARCPVDPAQPAPGGAGGW